MVIYFIMQIAKLTIIIYTSSLVKRDATPLTLT